MAYVVATRPQRFEVRESTQTPKGPRSRTLASFRELDDEVISKVRERAKNPPTAAELQEAALRAGAPLAATPVDRTARETLRSLARGERLDPKLSRLLRGVLDSENGHPLSKQDEPPLSDTARAAAQWLNVDPEERGKTLRELLELADALPAPTRPPEIGFPHLQSAA